MAANWVRAAATCGFFSGFSKLGRGAFRIELEKLPTAEQLFGSRYSPVLPSEEALRAEPVGDAEEIRLFMKPKEQQ